MTQPLLQLNDIIEDAETGEKYRVWWVSKTRCETQHYPRNHKGPTFVRDTSNGIKTYPKSDRIYRLVKNDNQ